MQNPRSFIARHRRPLVVVALALCMGLMLTLSVGAMPGYDTPTTEEVLGAVANGLDYVSTQQGESGGIDSFGFGIDMGGTARAIMALAATGRSVGTMAHATTQASPVDYLVSNLVTYTHAAGETDAAHLFPERAGICLVAAAAANLDCTQIGGMDLIAQIQDAYIEASGCFSTSVVEGYSSGWASAGQQAWCILGLTSVGIQVPEAATDWLLDQQAEDGTWAFGDPDTTALAVVALVGSGNVMPSHEAIQDTLQFFRDTQLPSGGWRPSWDADPLNVGSTAWVLQALMACGYVPPTASWAGSPNPVDGLLSMVQPNGSIGDTYVNAYSTIEAILGLAPQPIYMLGHTQRAQRALSWLHAQQNEDGSWNGMGGTPDVGVSCDAVLAFVAAGYDPDTIVPDRGTVPALTYLTENAEAYAETSPDMAGKVIMALSASGIDPRDVDGADLVQLLVDEHWDAQIGAYGIVTNTWHQAFAIFGLAAAGEAVPVSATQSLLALQQPSGGWKYDLGDVFWNETGADHTALAIQALLAAGQPVDSQAIQDGIAYIADAQSDDYACWAGANATAMAIMGLNAAGENLDMAPYVVEAGYSPWRALAAFQKVDGPVVFMWDYASDSLMATTQAVQALMGMTYPPAAGTLDGWADVAPGPDPDRFLIADGPQLMAGSKPPLFTMPFGSDLDGDVTVEAFYRAAGEDEWQVDAVVTRETGYYRIVLPNAVEGVVAYRVTVGDPDGLQFGSAEMYTTEFISEFDYAPREYIYLPMIIDVSQS